MYEETKWWVAATIVGILTVGGLTANNISTVGQTDQIAIKHGLVQKVEQSRIIWTKP